MRLSRRDVLYIFIAAIGLLSGLLYVKNSCCDVVYSDYIRLVDEYLPDVMDPGKFFMPDILTRVPAAFLARAVNVELFGFSVTFDRLLTLSGFALCSAALALYSRKKGIGLFGFAALIFILYSLNKWEIYINGSAWAHVVSFGLFFSYYYLFDGYARGDMREALPILCVLPFVILLFAGEYIASFSAIALLFAALLVFFPKAFSEGRSSLESKGQRARGGLVFLCLLIPLLLYLISRSFAQWEHAGSTELGFSEFFLTDPLFIPSFFVKSFAGVIVGGEAIGTLTASFGDSGREVFTLLSGLLVIGSYVTAIYIYLRERMYRETVFPMMLLLSGGFNHVLVTLSRWIFEDSSYGLSSRYAAQFSIGVLGIFIIFFLFLKKKRSAYIKGSLSILIILFLAGNCYTCYQEIKKMPYREQNYEAMAEAMKNHEAYGEEELARILEWHKDPETMLHAIEILEDNGLNVFRDKN